MIEISSTYIGDKKIWFTLESKPNGEQIAGYNKIDKIEVDELFSVLKIRSFENNITVAEDERFYFVNYHREDKKPLSFKLRKVQSSKKAFFYNGNAMNHSRELGLFSIFLNSLKYIWIRKHDIPFKLQRILGIPLSFNISQTIFGCSTSSIDSRHQLNEDNEILIGKNLYSKFYFQKTGKYCELKSISCFHNYKGQHRKTGELVFSNPLPDIRYLEIDHCFSQNAAIIINEKVLSTLLFTITRTSENFVYSIEGVSPSWMKRKFTGVQRNSIINYGIENE